MNFCLNRLEDSGSPDPTGGFKNIDIDFTQRPDRHVYAEAHKLSSGLAICKVIPWHLVPFYPFLCSLSQAYIVPCWGPSCLYWSYVAPREANSVQMSFSYFLVAYKACLMCFYIFLVPLAILQLFASPSVFFAPGHFWPMAFCSPRVDPC